MGSRMNTIFVYGTLMRGFNNNKKYLEGHVIERKPGFLTGYLYHLPYGYPAAVDGKGTIRGEICFIRDINEILPRLDYLEDYNQPGSEDLYIRTIREVRDQYDNIINCYVYLWCPKRLEELTKIGTLVENGDWREFNKNLNIE